MTQLSPYLPLIFMLLMGLATLAYVILDGYDLGVGILMAWGNAEQKNAMIASIGPFWDANETWLVLALGILLVAFPEANGIILGNLYIPTALMLAGLILRGVSFDFRAKAKDRHKRLWDRLFITGSLVTAFTQGFMLGSYILGFQHSLAVFVFSLLTGGCVVSGYALMGAAWLIFKTEAGLQKKAIRWARMALVGTALGMVLVSAATPLISERIFARWFRLPEFFLLLPVPMITGTLIIALDMILRKMPRTDDRYCWLPFAAAAGIFVLCFHGLAYSFYPFIIPDSMTIWQAASAPESLMVILWGVIIVLPCIIGYNILAYCIFSGKVRELSYY